MYAALDLEGCPENPKGSLGVKKTQLQKSRQHTFRQGYFLLRSLFKGACCEAIPQASTLLHPIPMKSFVRLLSQIAWFMIIYLRDPARYITTNLLCLKIFYDPEILSFATKSLDSYAINIKERNMAVK